MTSNTGAASEKWCIVANRRAESANRCFRPGARLVLSLTTGGGLTQGRAIMHGIAGKNRAVSLWLAFKHTHNWRVSWASPKDQADSSILFDTRDEAQKYLDRIARFLPKGAIEARAKEVHPV